MKLKYKILMFVFLFLIIPNVIACKNCLLYDVNITNLEVKDINLVGDAFTFDITLFNLESSLVKTSLTMEIYNPNNEIIYSGSKEVSFDPKDGLILGLEHPPLFGEVINKDGKQMKSYSAYFIPYDIPGIYKLKITPKDEKIKLVRCKQPYWSDEGCLGTWYEHNTYFFEAMSKGEKLRKDYLEQISKDIIQTSKDSSKISENALDISRRTEKATWIMLIVAVISLIVVIISLKNNTKNESL